MKESRSTIFFRSLIKKPATFVAVVIILLTALVALFAYPLAQDSSPFANRMILEFGARPPGFRKPVFLLPKEVYVQEDKNPAISWLSGTPSPYAFIPIQGYHLSNEGVYLHHYIDEGLEDTLFYSFDRIQLPAAYRSGSSDQIRQYLDEHRRSEIHYLLGSDQFGRDILSRLLVGARISLAVGCIAVILSLSIGLILGSLAGYFGGWVDDGIMWVINILWSIPTLLLVFAITLTIGKGFWEIFIAIGLTMWVSAARLIRGQVLVLRKMEYVTAARTLGMSNLRIIIRHIWPNIAGPVMVIAAANFATAILIEAGLSFLGIGVQPPQPSWGLMIKEHYNFLLTNKPLMAIIPGIAIMLLVFAFNILGNALRDFFDVQDR